MALAQPNPNPERRGPEFAKLYLQGLSDDPTLSGTEKQLLSVILHLQRNSRGNAWASHQYLADAIGRCRDHVRRILRLLNRKHAAGKTSWRVLSSRRIGRSNLYRVRVPEDVLAMWQSPPPPPRAPHAPASAPGPAPRLLDDDAKGTLFERRRPFSLFANTPAGMCMGDRLRLAVEKGEVTHVVTEHGDRHIARVAIGKHVVWLHLAVEGKPTQTEPLMIPLHQIGAWRFYA